MAGAGSVSELDKYERIYSYNFQENPRFVEGWKRVHHVIPQDKMYESLIKAEVFFYSREIEDVNLSGYTRWLNSNAKVVNNIDINTDKLPGSSAEAQPGCNNTITTPETDTQSCNSVGKHPANFADLIHMLQNGIKLPDTEDLNIVPTNEDPSPGQLQRPAKPWELVR